MAPGYYPDNPEVRRRSQKCYVDRPTNDVILRLHETDIVRVRPNGDVTLSTGGWATHKTLRSMNDALELFDMYVESSSNQPPRGDWVVYDADGTIFPYPNNKVNISVTIPGRGDDCHNRCKWLADAYNVAYTPTPQRASSARVVSAPAAPHAAAPRAAAVAQRPPATVIAAPRPPAAAAAPAGSTAPTTWQQAARAPAATAAPIAGQPGGTGSWANIARTGVSPPAQSHIDGHRANARVTGPGAVAPSAAAAPPAVTSPSGGLRALDVARSKLQAQAAAPRPVTEQIQDQMQKLGIHADELEDDAHLCVVCMDHPRSVVLVPCGHMALCSACCRAIIEEAKQDCPMCCTKVDFHVEVDG